MASTSSSLVLGFAARLPPRLFAPFAHSLRATGFSGRVGLVLGHYDADEADELGNLFDFTVCVDNRYERVHPSLAIALHTIRETPRVRRAYPLAFIATASAVGERRSFDWWSALEYELEGLQALRYRHYYDILQGLGEDADQVFLTDVRDVLFQRDPFQRPLQELEVFLEEPTIKIGTEPFNRKWIRNLYGASELTAIGDETASCSGTVAGRRQAVLHYLKEMIAAIGWRRRPLGSHDQGVHNHLLRRGRLGAVTIVQNGLGRVLTMGGMSRIHRDGAGTVLNADGSVPAVLHQYDRHPALADTLVSSLGRRLQ